MEKPTNVRVAESIEDLCEVVDGKWVMAVSAYDPYWGEVPPYDTDPGSAWFALEAYCENHDYVYVVRKFGRFKTVEIMKLPPEDRKHAFATAVGGGRGDTMPAAVCAAILASERK